eukprot:SAG31_NODE_37523_length_303_cov_1.014706_2_plen_27_part_01
MLHNSLARGRAPWDDSCHRAQGQATRF